MTIWVDSDSCPVRVREIVAKASFRLSVMAVFVANRQIPVKVHEYIKCVVTEQSEQAADIYIMECAKAGDLVITRDIPFASQLLCNEVTVINDRGMCFTKENIRERLSMRNFMYEVRSNGLITDKMGQFNKKNLQEFANMFDTVLTRLVKLDKKR